MAAISVAASGVPPDKSASRGGAGAAALQLVPAGRGKVTSLSLSRDSLEEPFDFGLGYTTDNRHVFTACSSTSLCQDGDQLLQLEKYAVATLTHEVRARGVKWSSPPHPPQTPNPQPNPPTPSPSIPILQRPTTLLQPSSSSTNSFLGSVLLATSLLLRGCMHDTVLAQLCCIDREAWPCSDFCMRVCQTLATFFVFVFALLSTACGIHRKQEDLPQSQAVAFPP